MLTLEDDLPSLLHQPRKTFHLDWYSLMVEGLLAKVSCLATSSEKPRCLANRWRVSTQSDEARGDLGVACGSAVDLIDLFLGEGLLVCLLVTPEDPGTTLVGASLGLLGLVLLLEIL